MYSSSRWPHVRVAGPHVWNFPSSSRQACPQLFSRFEIKEQAVERLKPLFLFLCLSSLSVSFPALAPSPPHLFFPRLENRAAHLASCDNLPLPAPHKEFGFSFHSRSFKYWNRGSYSALARGSTQSYFLKGLNESQTSQQTSSLMGALTFCPISGWSWIYFPININL